MTFLMMLLAGCGVSKADHERLERKVAALEKKVRAMDRGAARSPKLARSPRGRKPRAGGNAGQREARPRGTVAVEGDAVGVFVASKRHRLPVPGEIREGTFTALATFEAGQSPVEIGPITIEAEKTTTITCRKEMKRCQVSAPE